MRNFRKMARRWRTARPAATSSDDFLLPRRHMWAMLERERLRADRSGAVFSLLAFAPPPDARAPLAAALQRRLRATDVAGELSRDQLGVFLPDTPESGAFRVVEDVMASLPAELPPVHCEVYVYPHPWWPGDGDWERGEVETDDRNVHHQNGHGAPMGAGGGQLNGGQRPASSSNGRAPSAGDAVARAQPMRALFAQQPPRWKRSVDVAGALLGMAVLSPLFLAAGLAVKLTSRGPIFFRQQRAGLGGRPFTLWKFRTMRDAAEEEQGQFLDLNEQDGPAFKIKNDPRVTRVGRFLRSTSIDELPQLWNVLRGEMSLVGPRPLPLHEAAACAAWQQRRLDVTPGVTCIWQVEGRSTVPFDEWMRMDLRYVQRPTLLRDVQLLSLTIPAVLSRRGAS